MSEIFMKVTYSIKNVITIAGLIVFFILLDGSLFFTSPNVLMNIVLTTLLIGYSIYFVYLALNRIKEISYKDGKVSINRFLLSSLIFDGKDIKFISNDALRIDKKVFNLKFVLNKSELLSILINAMEIKDIDEAVNAILEGDHLYKSKDDIEKAVKNINITAIIMIAIIGLGFIAIVILNHWPIMFIVGTFILAGLSCLKDIMFEVRINKIVSNFLRLFVNGMIYLVCIALTIAFCLVIFKIFKTWNIDLMKINV